MFEHLFVDKLGNVISGFVKNLLNIPEEDNPTSITVAYDNHEKIDTWISFSYSTYPLIRTCI